MSLGLFDRFSNAVSRGAGRPMTFVAACVLIGGWAIAGPLTGFSEAWQLIINTGTTIITFLMVFVVQHTQNRDNDAIQAKLDDLIFAARKADNRLIGAEELNDAELQKLREITKGEVARDSTIIIKSNPKSSSHGAGTAKSSASSGRARSTAAKRSRGTASSKVSEKGD